MGEEERVEQKEEKEEEKKGIFASAIVRFLGIGLIALVLVVLAIGSAIIVSRKVMRGIYEEKKLKYERRVVPPPRATFNFKEPFKVTLVEGDEFHVLQIEIALAYNPKNRKLMMELEMRRAQLRDVINLVLRERSFREYTTPEAIAALKEILKEAVNRNLESGSIDDVYILDLNMS